MWKLRQEQGHALYIVIVVSFLLFLLLSHTLFLYLNQVKIVQMKEENLRAHLLLQSALALWLAELEDEFIEQIEWDGGIVRFHHLTQEEGLEGEWHIRIAAYPFQDDVRHRVELIIDKETKQIKAWTENISN